MTLEQMMKQHPEATQRKSAGGTLTTMNTAQSARRNAGAAPNRAKTCARSCQTTLTSLHDQSRSTNQVSDT